MSFTDRIDRELERRRASPKKAKAEIAALRARVEALEAMLGRVIAVFDWYEAGHMGLPPDTYETCTKDARALLE
jgi:P2-related tail formation protein